MNNLESIKRQIELKCTKARLIKQSKNDDPIVTASRQVIEEHSTGKTKNKYLGDIKLYTVDGQKVFKCSCTSICSGNHMEQPKEQATPRTSRFQISEYWNSPSEDDYISRIRRERKLPVQSIALRCKSTKNSCSFCLKPCQTFTCDNCYRLKYPK